MQLEIDYGRSCRFAQRNDAALAAIHVPPLQRAAIFLMQQHPHRVQSEDGERVYRLAISYRAAARWLNQNWLRDGVKFDPRGLSRAIAAWVARGVMLAQGGRRTTLWIDVERLEAWERSTREEAEELTREWRRSALVGTSGDEWGSLGTSGDERGPVGIPGDARGSVGTPGDSLREGGRSGFLNEKKRSSSLSHSSPPPLPPIPLRAFEQGTTPGELYATLAAWWSEFDLEGRFEPEAILGAILAARKNLPADPQTYVERCVAQGVLAGYITQARDLLRSQRPRDDRHAPDWLQLERERIEAEKRQRYEQAQAAGTAKRLRREASR